MRIGNNISAMNTLNRLTVNNSSLSKSLEKLSSGSAINRAADDAAGLAISEKMRAQIAGLEQASKNAQDGISLVQTAEGALDQTHTALRRMETLAMKATNGTITAEDRAKIQAEVDARTNEIDRVAETSNFNGIKLFDGSLSGSSGTAKMKALNTAAGADDGLSSSGTITFTGGVDGVKVSFATGTEGASWNTTNKELTITLDGTGKTYSDADVQKLIDAAVANAPTGAENLKIAVAKADGSASGGTITSSDGTDATGSDELAADFTDTTTRAATFSGYVQASNEQTINGATVTATADEGVLSNGITINFNSNNGDASASWSTNTLTITLDNSKTTYSEDEINALIKNATGTKPVGSDGLKVSMDKAMQRTSGAYEATAASADLVLADGAGAAGGGLSLQIGATSNQADKITVSIAKMDSASLLGTAKLDMSTPDAANAAIDKINAAIEKVSEQRANLGATQNRLEQTIENLSTTAENMSAAESRIRDVDMAKQMTEFTKFSILSQASQAMLAQANSLPQGVLQLLK
ncbi:flagellin [Acetanaerobacterium elongatum]|uniref:Flagellin n=1 Tax=Acetanaerobacterium elongatum TaxID=258515 RepID=A0A1G9V3B6_9FIRM|nr:flagellin [Acetanaerobacterium elongatum]SDM66583.1 flagellin [Acetanaerobacterium elongatum]